ncbi:MAG: hypothetical protein JXR72_00415, partial [Proteobacteria bacterium]|nr:hypothetical protein [Pseudomonadota bacterium]
MPSDLSRLGRLIRQSGRLADPAGLEDLLGVLAGGAADLGLNRDFTRRVVTSSLRTADPRAALNRMARVLTSVQDPNFYSLLEDPAGIRSLMVILGYSHFLSSLILR